MRTRLFDITSNSYLHNIFLDLIYSNSDMWSVSDVLDEYYVCDDDLKFTYIYDDESPSYMYEFQSANSVSKIVKEVNKNCDLQLIFRIDFEKMIIDCHMIYIEFANIEKQNISRTFLFCINDLIEDYSEDINLEVSLSNRDYGTNVDTKHYKLLLCSNTSFLHDNYKTDKFGNIYMVMDNNIIYIGLCKHLLKYKQHGIISCNLFGQNNYNITINFGENTLYCESINQKKYILQSTLHVTTLLHVEKVQNNRELINTCNTLSVIEEKTKKIIENYNKECVNFNVAYQKYINHTSMSNNT